MNKTKEIEKVINNEFSKKELFKMLSGATQAHISLVKYLYDHHRNILREYEKSTGSKIQIHFAGRSHDSKNN